MYLNMFLMSTVNLMKLTWKFSATLLAVQFPPVLMRIVTAFVVFGMLFTSLDWCFLMNSLLLAMPNKPVFPIFFQEFRLSRDWQ